MDQSVLREIRVPRPSWVLVLVIAACVLGFALTYSWIHQGGISAELPAAAPLTRPGDDRARSGLAGPVNRVRTEIAKLSLRSGRPTEGPRELLELTIYDRQGNRVESNYYLVSSSQQVGHEEYAYDDKGNISELTLRDEHNSIIGRESYTYDYDAQGNWTRMVTTALVNEGGKMVRQPKEVTYRTITYYTAQSLAETTGPHSVQADSAPDAQEKFAPLRGALDGWVAATNSRDLDKLMSFYDARLNTFYMARNVSREFVRSEKARLFKRADLLDIRASAPEITINRTDNTALMYFRKQYVMTGNGQERSGEVLQQLRWRRTGDEWKIVGERDAQVLR